MQFLAVIYKSQIQKCARSRVRTRISRIESTGNYEDCEPVGEGVFELRFIGKGPGHRVYLGIGGSLIILLPGGDKSTQKADIRTAITYWKDYNA
ncbi:MAG: type II toxin-antitoxin system RelE/ParE family toxin [Bryobacteraceae bacterium]